MTPRAGARLLREKESPAKDEVAGASAFDSFYLKDRYGSKAMRAIWSDRAMVQAWLDCEAALALAESEVGVVPTSAAREIAKAARVGNVNLGAMRAEFDQTWNPVLPLVNVLRARLSEKAAQWVHWGATSKNIMDTGSALQIKATYAVVEAGLDRIESALVVLARKHRDTLMAARTHGQQAIPVTLGYKVAVWIDDIRRQRERLLESRKRVLVCEFGGAVGTMAASGKIGLRIQERFAKRLGLGVPLIPTKTAGDRFAEFFLVLSSISGTFSKIAAAVYNHQQSDIDELSEFSVGKVGSSAMPHKLNPVASGSVVLLFRLIKARATAVLDYVHCEWEDDHRQGETLWSFGPEISLLFGAQLELLARVLESLIVKPENMLRNLERSGGAVLSEALMMALAKKMGRDAAHAHVLGLSRRSRAEDRSFCDIARSDPKVKTLVTRRALDRALDYRSGVGLSTYFVDSVLGTTATARRPRQKKPSRNSGTRS
ncbi:MAG: adenylosuccinate lyase family protein [Vicinamibacteria bacterium]|nr:adenylosuccinate lyase family protein [Vicinamibacteria bacterium]